MKKITSVLTFWMAAALLLSTQYSIAQSYNLLVSKDASTNFTRTIEWSISNEVYPETFDMFTGDVATAEYTITVFKGVADSDWTAQGSIVISNNSPLDATITGISDVVSPDIPVNLDCGVTFPYSLPAGATLVCTYAVDLPDGSNRVNTVTVTTTGDVGGGTGSADIIFEEPTEVIGYDVVLKIALEHLGGLVAMHKLIGHEPLHATLMRVSITALQSF